MVLLEGKGARGERAEGGFKNRVGALGGRGREGPASLGSAYRPSRDLWLPGHCARRKKPSHHTGQHDMNECLVINNGSTSKKSLGFLFCARSQKQYKPTSSRQGGVRLHMHAGDPFVLSGGDDKQSHNDTTPSIHTSAPINTTNNFK